MILCICAQGDELKRGYVKSVKTAYNHQFSYIIPIVYLHRKLHTLNTDKEQDICNML